MSSYKFYIAGPISGHVDHNRDAFLNAQRHLEEIGIPRENIFNPIISEESVMVQNGDIRGEEAYRICMKIDLNWICDHANALYMLFGWEKSRGAVTEHALGVALGLQIVYQSNEDILL